MKLKELKTDKAPGSDGFLPRLLKAVADGMASYQVLKAVADGVALHICLIFNRSLATGMSPATLGLRIYAHPEEGTPSTEG